MMKFGYLIGAASVIALLSFGYKDNNQINTAATDVEFKSTVAKGSTTTERPEHGLFERDGEFVIAGLVYGGIEKDGTHQCTVSARKNMYGPVMMSEHHFVIEMPRNIYECASDNDIHQLVDSAFQFLKM